MTTNRPCRGRAPRVHPIQLAVQQRRGAVVGEAGKLARGNVEGVQIVAAAEGNAHAVGRELGIVLGFGSGGELFPGTGRQRKPKQVAADGEQQALAIRTPFQLLRAHVAILPLVAGEFGRGNSGFFERFKREQPARGFAREVVQHDVRALKKGEAFSIRRPDYLRHLTLTAVLHQGVDGDGFFLRQNGKRREARENKNAGEHLLRL